MNKFEIGERVIALTNPLTDADQQREKGKIYRVLAIMYCSTDGHQLIHIGGRPKITTRNELGCSCGKIHPLDGLSYTNSKHFAKVDENTLENMVTEENYEIAAIIRDELQIKS